MTSRLALALAATLILALPTIAQEASGNGNGTEQQRSTNAPGKTDSVKDDAPLPDASDLPVAFGSSIGAWSIQEDVDGRPYAMLPRTATDEPIVGGVESLAMRCDQPFGIMVAPMPTNGSTVLVFDPSGENVEYDLLGGGIGRIEADDLVERLEELVPAEEGAPIVADFSTGGSSVVTQFDATGVDRVAEFIYDSCKQF